MENIYIKTKDKYKCNGCTACMYVCPTHAIYMSEDSEGFIYPKIDESKCIHCGKCLKFCSNTNKEYVGKRWIAYGAQHLDKDILFKSSSGGVFYALMENAFKKTNAVIYGATYDDNMKVVHKKSEDIKSAMAFMGSKYVRSDIIDVYSEVKKD